MAGSWARRGSGYFSGAHSAAYPTHPCASPATPPPSPLPATPSPTHSPHVHRPTSSSARPHLIHPPTSSCFPPTSPSNRSPHHPPAHPSTYSLAHLSAHGVHPRFSQPTYLPTRPCARLPVHVQHLVFPFSLAPRARQGGHPHVATTLVAPWRLVWALPAVPGVWGEGGASEGGDATTPPMHPPTIPSAHLPPQPSHPPTRLPPQSLVVALTSTRCALSRSVSGVIDTEGTLVWRRPWLTRGTARALAPLPLACVGGVRGGGERGGNGSSLPSGGRQRGSCRPRTCAAAWKGG